MKGAGVLYQRVRGGALLLLLLLGLSDPSGAAAQVSVAQSRAGEDRNAQLRELSSKLGEAIRLLRTDPAQAMVLLKRLRLQYPQEIRVLDCLAQAYQAQGEVDSAMVLFRQSLALNKTDQEAVRALGIILYGRGEEERADQLFQQFVKDSRNSVGAYQLIGDALVEVGRSDRALVLYQEGLGRSDQHFRLKLDIADLERARGDLPAALSDYLDFVERFPDFYRRVMPIIAQMFDDLNGPAENSPPAADLLANLEERAARTETAKSEMLEILAGVYLNRGLLEKALEAALDSDRAKRTNGEALFQFTERLWYGYLDQQGELKRRYFKLCGRALAAYEERYPRTPLSPTAAYRRAYLGAEAARGIVPMNPALDPADPFEAALRGLDEIMARFPRSPEAAQAALIKGDLMFEIGRRPQKALAVYQEGLKRSSQITGNFAERIGRMYLVLGEYDEARRHFDMFIRSSQEQRREAGIYYLGVLFTFTGEYGAARDTLTSLARLNPSSPYTNDAIELAWVIDEGMQKNEKVLGYYIEAMKAEMALDSARVADRLEKVVADGADSALRPRALYRLGGVYAGQKQYEKALDRLQRFGKDYPDNDLRPDVQRAVGRVYEYGLGRPELALKEYQTILMKYPNYIFIDEVRKDITRLEPGGS